MRQKVISAGHICLDITPVFSNEKNYSRLSEILEPGKLIRMNPADVHTGGSVANTGLALKILGNEVALMGKIGKDAFGTMIENILSEYGVTGLIKDENSSTSYSVVLAVPGIDRIFLHDPGANDTFVGDNITDEDLEGAVLFHFGYPPLMRNMYINEGAELVGLFKRIKGKGIVTSLDMSAVDPESEAGNQNWMAILNEVMPYTDLFFPSFEEICFMMDRAKYKELAASGGDMIVNVDINRDVKPIAERLIEMGARVVVIKCGEKGMYYCTANKEKIYECMGPETYLNINVDEWAEKRGHQACFKADIVRSATGAGDTSIAAFLTAMLNGKNPELSIALAAAEGACAVTTYDALSGLKNIDELEKMIINHHSSEH